MFKKWLLLAALAVFADPTDPAQAGGKNVAIIDDFIGDASFLCQLLATHGHPCTVFPKEGPTGPLDPFDVVIDMSGHWNDPAGTLADCMREGKTVITVFGAPIALGVNSNSTVQAWIGANFSQGAGGRLVTTESDPILGDLPPGTELVDCGASICGALRDTTGHSNAKILATYVDHPDPDPIGIMRNFWEGGVSVYMMGFFEEFILNALEVRNPIPTLNTWGLLALLLGIGAAGTIVLWRRQSIMRSRATPIALLGACLLAASAPLQAYVTTNQENGVTHLRLGAGEPFHSTEKTIVDLRSLPILDPAGTVVLWAETDASGLREPFYAISLDGSKVEEVRATSYDLQLRYARFDPAIEQPAIPAALLGDAESELYIVQFVTQSLSAFTVAIETHGAVIYDFLPNHAYIARLPPQARAGVEALPFVRAVVPYHPAYRLERFLFENVDRPGQLDPMQRYNIRVFQPNQKIALTAKITAIGGLVDSADAGKRMVQATLTPIQLYQVARFEEVLFIDRWHPIVPAMDAVRINGGANDLETAANYRGVGVRGEVLDSAFNLIHNAFGSSDACSPSTRVPLIQHGCALYVGNHGASTSGIIFGNGAGNANGRGLLPCGQGIVASYANLGQPGCASRYTHTGQLVKSEYCPTSPPDPNCPYQAVFHSASFGVGASCEGGDGTEYATISADIDDILFDVDIVLCQGQGNFGNDQEGSLSLPEAWAKNTISVGGYNTSTHKAHRMTAGAPNRKWTPAIRFSGLVQVSVPLRTDA